MKYDFMRCNADQFSLAGMCRALSVSRSGYYAWKDRRPEARQAQDLALAAHVRRGAYRLTRGVRRAQGLEGTARRRYRLRATSCRQSPP